ncbi:hypothetical protein C0165_03010 [Moraxella catarrhalis]|nr:hypothetical protein [Moraxella catarrhalis]
MTFNQLFYRKFASLWGFSWENLSDGWYLFTQWFNGIYLPNGLTDIILIYDFLLNYYYRIIKLK